MRLFDPFHHVIACMQNTMDTSLSLSLSLSLFKRESKSEIEREREIISNETP
jgi:hypothetical protein